MLNSLNLNDKTYDELLAEAIAQIPLYTSEWTNFNVSDPGITILQNLTAFQLLQQEAIDGVPEEVLRKLLKLVGCTGRENRPATVLVQAPAEGGPLLREGRRFWSGTIPFEIERTTPLSPWGLAAVFVKTDEGTRDVTRLLTAPEGTAYPFGRRPLPGNALECVLSGVPEVGEPLYLWADVADEELRNPFADGTEIPDFASVRWQYWTESGWRDAETLDETRGFLRSGCVTLRLTGPAPAARTDGPMAGCALRCLLEEADYDRAPRLRLLAVHLFPVVQKQTRVRCCVRPGGETVELLAPLSEEDVFEVFCRETADGPYYRYHEAGRGHADRVYRLEPKLDGVTLRFDADGGRVPCETADAVRVVWYDGEMIHHRLLGPVYGYDRQELQLEQVENVLPESLLVAVERQERDGETSYSFLAPGETGPGGFSYHLRSKEARIVIDEPAGGGFRLLLAGCAVTQGERGNLRPRAVLETRGGYDGTEVEERWPCPTPGWGGVSSESVEALRLRFSAELRRPAAAVRAEDWEELVRGAPGLCIHKVKAAADTRRSLIRIAVKPYTEDALPKLSPAYLRQLQAYLEPRRMLTTRFELCQPNYVPVSVNAALSIRGMASHARTAAEELLRELLDHVNGPEGFGGWVRFDELYRALSALPFVEAVDALSLYPEDRGGVMLGGDIRLEDDSLCYPGTIHLTLREYGR